MARQVSKAGGLARQAAQRFSPSSATGNGRPQHWQHGPSRNVTADQQAAQTPGSATVVRQAMHCGGKIASRTALAMKAGMAYPVMDDANTPVPFRLLRKPAGPRPR